MRSGTRNRIPFAGKISIALVACLLCMADLSFALEEQKVKNALRSSGFSVEALSKEEIETLTESSATLTVVDGMENISFSPEDELSKKIIEDYRSVEPKFLIESVFVLPVDKGEEGEVLEEVQNFLMEVTRFVGIPYWSKEHERYYDLFSWIEVLDRKSFDDGSRGLVTEQLMKPFKPYESLYRYWLNDESFVYTNTNTSPLRYKKMSFVRAVKEGDMFTGLFVFSRPGVVVFYGIGGVHTFSILGMFDDRLLTSFRGRTQAFFKWFNKDFVKPRLRQRN